jgi:hypothetical protein
MISALTKDVTEATITAYFDRLCATYSLTKPARVTLIKALAVAYVVFVSEVIAVRVFDVIFLFQ